MALFGGVSAGDVYVRLGAKFDDDGFRRYDREIDRAERHKRVETVLAGDYDGREIRRYNQQLDRIQHRVRRRDLFKAKLGADYNPQAFRNYERELSRSERVTRNATRSTDRHSKALRYMGRSAAYAIGAGGFGGGFYALFRVLKTSNDEFRESERVTRLTQQVLKSTGGAAGVTARQIERLSLALSRNTGIDDEAIQASQNLLLTFRDVKNEAGRNNDVFNQASAAITDMATAMNHGATPSTADLHSATLQLGKALQDPIRGLGALRRVGVQLTDAQEDQVRALTESGNKMAAQKIILHELNLEFGGAAEATATSGQKLRVNLGNLAETVGRALAPTLNKAATSLNRFVTQMLTGKGAGGEFVKTMQDLWKSVGPVVVGFGKAVVAVGKFAAEHPKLTKVAVAIGLVGVAVNAIRTSRALRGIETLIGGLARLGKTRAGQRAAEAIVVPFRGLWGRLRGVVARVMASMATAFGVGGATAGRTAAVGSATSFQKTVGRSGKFRAAGAIAGGLFVAGMAVTLAAELGRMIEDAIDKVSGKPTGGGDIARSGSGKGGPFWEIGDLFKRKGGKVNRFNQGGLVPAYVSPGEMAVSPGGGVQMVPGQRQAADSVLGFFRAGTSIITDHGQQMLSAGASLAETLRHQLPHFVSGGTVAAAARKKGLRGDKLTTSVAIAGAESGWDEKNVSPTDDHGLWQINKRWHPQYFRQQGKIYNVDYNAGAMSAISGRGSNWNPWTTYKTGKWREWLSRAQKATKATPGAERAGKVAKYTASMPSRLASFYSGFSAEAGTSLWDNDILPDILAGTRKNKLSSRRKGSVGTGPGGASGRLGQVIKAASAHDKANYAYDYGSGHSNPAPSVGPYDCSSAVARVLQVAGFKNFSTSNSGAYMSRGKAGLGKNLSVMSTPGHTYMIINGKAWGTATATGGGGWISGYTTRPGFVARHPTDMAAGVFRKGGKVPRFQTGGVTPRATLGALQAGKVDTKQGLYVFSQLIDAIDENTRWLLARRIDMWRAELRKLRQGGVSPRERPQVRELRRQVRGAVEETAPGAAPSYGRLERMGEGIQRRIGRIRRDGVTSEEEGAIKRLQAAWRLVSVEMGRRVAMGVSAATKVRESVASRATQLDAFFRTTGTDSSSSQGLSVSEMYQRGALTQLKRAKRMLTTALKRAVRAGDSKAVAAVQEELKGLNAEIYESAVSLIETMRAKVVAAVQEGVDTAQNFVSGIQKLFDKLGLQQRLAGTYDTPGGAQERSDFLLTKLVPSLQNDRGALLKLYNVLVAQGKTNDARAVWSDIMDIDNQILQAQVDAKDILADIADNTADQTALLDQVKTQLEDAKNDAKRLRDWLSTVTGPGDIGTGGLNALRAARVPFGSQEATGPGGSAFPPPNPYGVHGTTVNLTVNTLHPGSPGVLKEIGNAAVAAFSYQGGVPSSKERLGI